MFAFCFPCVSAGIHEVKYNLDTQLLTQTSLSLRRQRGHSVLVGFPYARAVTSPGLLSWLVIRFCRLQ
jgi:hypothetical protein